MNRTAYARGTRPARPGDHTARVAASDRASVEALKKATQDGDPFELGFAAGWNNAFDTAWDKGADWAFGVMREAGLPVDAVLSLEADDTDEGE